VPFFSSQNNLFLQNKMGRKRTDVHLRPGFSFLT